MSTFDRIVSVFNKVVPSVDCSNVTMDTVLTSDLGLDSLKMLHMVILLEDEFGIKLGYDVKLCTVGDVVEWIESKI